MARTCYACTACGYHGPASYHDAFTGFGYGITATHRICSKCGEELTRAERLDDDQHPCEVCHHAVGGDDGRCYTCAVADAFDDALCESRAVVSDLHMTIRDIVRCQAGAL